ncbi:hypothetical protein DFS34DRAFT_584408 [Phlyctochytrium arcticum]|nr:hypothetical protein DFS34DRAFT_584408 [Phlyctochytrium arcticum]
MVTTSSLRIAAAILVTLLGVRAGPQQTQLALVDSEKTCYNNATLVDGRICDCPTGFGAENCGSPTCGSPADGLDRPLKKPGESCLCTNGWTGINCNVCMSQDACVGPVGGLPGDPAVCISSVRAVNQNFLQCEITNKKIVEILNPRKPEITYSCNSLDSTCDFQFWAAEEESFWCSLWDCASSELIYPDRNRTSITCQRMHCGCYPGRTLCDPNELDLSEWFDTLDPEDPEDQGPVGPAFLQCDSYPTTSGEIPDRSCIFSEKHMNKLISDFFVDPYIELSCAFAGECVRLSQVPEFGTNPPPSPPPPEFPEPQSHALYYIICIAALTALLLLLFFTALRWSFKISSADFNSGYVHENSTDRETDASMMTHHVPVELMFRDVSYHIERKSTSKRPSMAVLNGVEGIVKPGEVMAIMGGSGAGKTTFLDILASRSKSGKVSGDILVNKSSMSEQEYKAIIGYVDQEDTLMDTLTVYETIMYSALLRLPSTMLYEAKRNRVIESMLELDILNIAHRRIGTAGKRGISGGEKRRVSIACELVTGASVLFLDEPTSGLDSYNAYNVVECLVNLARNYHRTVVFTIHQPRSNIYALFDKLVLLAKGRVVYSGPAQEECADYFQEQGYKCPTGYNIADYLVDLTMHVANENEDNQSNPDSVLLDSPDVEEHAVIVPIPTSNSSGRASVPQQPRRVKSSVRLEQEAAFSVCAMNRRDIQQAVESNANAVGDNRMESRLALHVQRLISATSSHSKRPGLWFQFQILSSRIIKNLYRNPHLLLTHYALSITVALWLGFLFWKIDLSLSGFQNRMGVFFFICSVFGFGCLSSMQSFASERLLFMRERANHYYNPISYFLSKVVYDLIPLRVIPPIIFSLICYNMIGLREDDVFFHLRFTLVLILFNMTAAACCLAISIILADGAVATLAATLLMLFEMLFGGMLLNKYTIPKAAQWLCDASFFNAGWEALIVNEVNGLTLFENRNGLKFSVGGRYILKSFGLEPEAFWPDIRRLGIMVQVFLVVAFLWLAIFVRERR